MTSFLGPATVSAALQSLLRPAVSGAVAGAEVWVDRSDVSRQTPGVNVYLYRTSIDAAQRNEELPVRRADGSLRARPTAPTNLHYLLTCHGKDDEMQPQRLLGAVLARLHTQPCITRALVAEVTEEALDPQGMHKYLALNDLVDAEDLVRVTPEPLDLDDLSTLWSVFFQTPYQLSATYRAGSILLEETPDEPVPAPPATQPQLSVRGLLHPTIISAHNATDPRSPVVANSVVQVDGSGLRGEETVVRIGAAEVVVDATEAHATSLSADLSTVSVELRAGLQPVVVTHRWLVGDPPRPRGGEVSNAVGVMVAARITLAVTAGEIEVTADLPVGPRQDVSVLLLERMSGRPAVVLGVPDRAAESSTITVPHPSASADLPADQYAVVLSVDGAQSPVTRDASGTIVDPLVVVS